MNGETGQVRTALVENLKELHLPANNPRDESRLTLMPHRNAF